MSSINGANNYVEAHGLFFHTSTREAVRKALSHAWANNIRVRLWYGNTDTGEAWLEEHDVVGYVGRSTGRIKVPLLIHNRRCTGGGAILDHCIVRIDDTSGKTLYRHPLFRSGTDELETVESDHPGYRSQVIRRATKDVIARFPTAEGAGRWLRFMRGERYCR